MVVQQPGGRVQRLYWATSAAEVMRANPGHYVALVTLRGAEERQDAPGGERRTVRLTRVKLLKPKETLLLGHVYRLITTQGASSVLKNKRGKWFRSIEISQHSKNIIEKRPSRKIPQKNRLLSSNSIPSQ